MFTRRFSSRVLSCIALSVLAAGIAAVAVAQTGDAEITGTVRDPSGSPVPAATVTITNQDTGVSRSVTPNSDGYYRFFPLSPGRYTLKVESPGFKTESVSGILVNIGLHVDRDISLTVGNVQETVTVTGEVPPIDPTKGDVSGILTNMQIDTLPVNTRQYLNLALLMPGTTQDASRTFYNNVQIGGAGHYYANGFAVDGVVNTWAEMGEPRQNIPKGAVQEFKVNVTQYKADQGLSMGGFVNVVTKSGTNELHGEAFEYARDAVLNRDNEFQKQTEQQQGIGKAPFRRNQFGADIGGPVVKNRLHFYAAYERTQTSDSYTIFTGAQGHPYYSALEGTFKKPGYDQLANARGDFQITNDQHLFGRYSQEWNFLSYNGCGGSNMSNCYDGKIPRHSLVLGHTWTPRPSLVNEFRFQYAFASYQLGPSGFPVWTEIGKLTPERIAPLQTVLIFPSFSWGFDYADVGVEKRYEFKDDVSLIKGAHTIKFGFDTSYIPFGDDAPNGLKGNYTFGHDHYFNPNDPASLAAIAASNDVLTFTATVPPIYTKAPTTQVGLYIQDDWRATHNLTINLGLRYDREFGAFNENLNPGQFPMTIPFLGDPSKRGAKHNFGPRVGLAWDIFGKGRDVVRAGFGLYYNNLQTLQNFPELRNFAQCSVLISRPSFPDPYGGLSPTNFCSTAAPTVNILTSDYRNPYAEQFNLGYARQLTGNLTVEADVVYIHSVADYRTEDLNYPVNGVRPFPQFARILAHAPISQSKYKALYLRAEKRFAGRYQFLVSYSLSNNRDDNPQTQVVNPSNYQQDWGPANIDRRHSLVAGSSFLLPAKITLGAIWTLRSSLPFSALSNNLDVDGIRQYVPGTSRNLGDRSLNLDIVNAYRATLGLAPITSANINSSRFNSFDIRVSRALFVREQRKLEIIGQVFNLFGTENLASAAGQVSTGGNQTNTTSPNFGSILGANNLQQAELAARFVF
jgi:hypothetical protein